MRHGWEEPTSLCWFTAVPTSSGNMVGSAHILSCSETVLHHSIRLCCGVYLIRSHNPVGLMETGIFRLPGQSSRVQALKELYDEGITRVHSCIYVMYIIIDTITCKDA